MNAGEFLLGTTFDLKFTTIDSAGAGSTLSSGAIAAYPGNSTTEITAGITLSADFDGRTGLNNVRVVATSGNGYAAATNYCLVLTAGTVDGVSVAGYVVAHFSVENRTVIWNAAWDAEVQSEAADALTAYDPPTNAEMEARTIAAASYATAANLATVDTVVDSILEDTGTTLPATLSTIAGYIDTEVASVLAAVDTEVAAILADTDELQTDWVDGGRLDLILDARASQASVDTVDNFLDTEIAAILEDTGTTLDGKLDTIDTVVDAIKVQTDKLTFTVANELDANVQSINDTALTGDGSATPWGPA